MSGEMRWQDWINALLGVVLFITPFVFGDTSQTAAAWTAYVGGVLLFVFGRVAAVSVEPDHRIPSVDRGRPLVPGSMGAWI